MKKRFLSLFLSAALVFAMLVPVQADVMRGISVDGTYFEVGGGNRSGDGWRWDDANRTLSLDGFYSNDLGFYNCNNVTLLLAGENQIFSTSSQGLWVEGTTLTIEGDGKLTAPFLAASESDVTVNGGTLYFAGSDSYSSYGAGIYGFLSNFTFSGGTVFAGGRMYGMRLGFGSNLTMTRGSFMELYGPEAALVRMEVYTPAGTASFDEAFALSGLPTGASLLGGNEANDRNALHFVAVGGVKSGDIGYVAALTAGKLVVGDPFADEPVINGAATRAYLEGTGGLTSLTKFLPAPSDLTWGKAYDLTTAKLVNCPAGLSWKVSGDTDGVFTAVLYNESGAGYEVEDLSLNNGLEVKNGRYYMTLDLVMDLFLSAPLGNSYTIEVTNVSATNGVGNSDPATATISDATVAAWLEELGFEREETPVYDEEDTTIPKQWRAYERGMEIMLNDYYVPLTAYALKDPTTGYETNYVRVRDIAVWMEMTSAYFNVSWDGAVNLIPGQGYEPNGTELDTPFWGTQRYTFSTAATKVNGTVKEMEAILLKDDDGNGYTYYKLRDLGNALGFKVDWSAQKGVYIETE